jgi:hypothetical protein
MTDQDYYRIDGISSVLRIIDPDIKNRILSEYLHYPKAYAEIVDVDSSVTTLASCQSYTAYVNSGNLSDSFNCTLRKGITWNPRTQDYNNLLSVDSRKRIHIYTGQSFSDVPKYEKIFTGVIKDNPESYAFGQEENIQLRGGSLRILLDQTDGAYENGANFTGTSKELIAYWMNEMGIMYVLDYEDYIEFDDEEIGYDNVLTGINTILNALGPRVIAFFSPAGVFIMRDIPDGTTGDVEFEYDSSNLRKVRRYTEGADVVTAASVIGIDDEAIADGQASVTMINKYGKNLQTISSGFVLTSDRAEQLVDDILDMGRKYENQYEATITLNPYIWKSSLIKLNDASVSSIVNTLVRLNFVSHMYRAGSSQVTLIRGYDA